MTPTIYKRRIDHRWIAVLRLPSGKTCRRGTRCRDKQSAQQWADLAQRDVTRRAENGDLLPPKL